MPDDDRPLPPVGYNWLLVTDAELEALAAGQVPEAVQRQASRLDTPLQTTLQQNAAREGDQPNLFDSV